MSFTSSGFTSLLIGWVWMAVAVWGYGAEMTLVPAGANWRFLAGRSEASSPDPRSWRGAGFDDRGWVERPAVFYYGESGLSGTLLTDMQGGYSSFFLRRSFVVSDPGAANGVSVITNVVSEVHFNVTRCTFNRPFDLWLSCATPVATIRYTTDGRTPTGREVSR